MKFNIHIKELPNQGMASTVIGKKEYGISWTKDLYDLTGENTKKRKVSINALKARVMVEMIKEKEEIRPGRITDLDTVNNPKYLQTWKDLDKQITFEIKND